MDSDTAVRELADRVAHAGSALRRLGPEGTLASLAEAARSLADPSTPTGAQVRADVARTSGLSGAMVDWALRTNVAPDDLSEELARLAAPLRAGDGAGPRALLAAPPRLAAVVLAGNVFTAALRAVAVPLLAGTPVVLKASSHDDAFPRWLERALLQTNAAVGQAVGVVTFAGGDEALEDALFAGADVVSVYGSDATVQSIRARLPATTRLVAHGHGLGVAYVPAAALGSEAEARAVAEAVALDVAAFDQRGCLSPHGIFVERGGAIDGLGLSRLLAGGPLDALERSLPRGPLPVDAGAAQVQWRGVAAARGVLFERDGYAVSHEGDAALRVSPGWRNVGVYGLAGFAAFVERLRPLGVHLKAVGVAGDAEARRALARALPPPLAPRVSQVGTMQTPPLGSLSDGEPPWVGVTRFVQVD
jgi:hypothetical protein